MVRRTAENGQHRPTTANGESPDQDGFSARSTRTASSSRPCSAATTSAGTHPDPGRRSSEQASPQRPKRVPTHSRPWPPPRPLDQRLRVICPLVFPSTAELGRSSRRILSRHLSEQELVRAG